jgi:glycosyltransferase involved in cell wall biosynthesis
LRKADFPRPPVVSAIIVVRNGLPYIGEAIESVLEQRFRDWELLIVDDGSTDATLTIAGRYQTDHPTNVRVLVHPGGQNLGIAASRNLGIAEACGKYVAFLDADDLWLPQKLSEQVEILEQDPTLGMVYGRSLIWHEWHANPSRSNYYYELGVEPDSRYEPPVLFELLLENRAQTPTTCSAMIRADLFQAVGLFDPSARGMFEDMSFFGKVLATTPTYVSGRTWAKYRQHDGSCTAVSSASGGDEWARLRALGRLDRSLAAYAPPRRVRHALHMARIRAGLSIAQSWRRELRRRLRRS